MNSIDLVGLPEVVVAASSSLASRYDDLDWTYVDKEEIPRILELE